jgi:hypothetical protein
MQRAIDPSIPARLITDAVRLLVTFGEGPLRGAERTPTVTTVKSTVTP